MYLLLYKKISKQLEELHGEGFDVGLEMFETWYKMGSILPSCLDISPVIIQRFPVDRFQQGFDVMNTGLSG